VSSKQNKMKGIFTKLH